MSVKQFTPMQVPSTSTNPAIKPASTSGIKYSCGICGYGKPMRVSTKDGSTKGAGGGRRPCKLRALRDVAVERGRGDARR